MLTAVAGGLVVGHDGLLVDRKDKSEPGKKNSGQLCVGSALWRIANFKMCLFALARASAVKLS